MRSTFLSLVLCVTQLSAETLVADPANDIFTTAQLSLDQARSSQNAQDFAIAEKWLERFIKGFPENENIPEAHYYLATVKSKLNKPAEASQYFQAYLAKVQAGQMAGVAALQLALDQYNAKQYPQTLELLATSNKELAPGSSKNLSFYLTALCLQNLKQYEQLAPTLDYLLAQKDASKYHLKCRFLKAGYLLHKKNYPQAYKEFQHCAKQSENKEIQSKATIKAALLAQTLNDIKGTERYHSAVLQDQGLATYHPKSALTLMNLAVKKQDWKTTLALEKFGEQGLSAELKFKRLFMIGKAYDATKNLSKAELYFRKAISSNPQSAVALEAYYLILSKSSAKKLNLADALNFISLYQKEHKDDPRLHNIRLLIAEHYYGKQQYDLAQATYAQLNLDHIVKDNHPSILYRNAICLFQGAQPSQAIPAVDQYAKAYPKDARTPHLLFKKANFLAQSGKTKDALKTAQQVSQFKKLPDDLKKSNAILESRLLIKAELFSKAEPAFLNLIKKYAKGSTKDTLADWHFWTAYSQYKSQKYSPALKSFSMVRQLAPSLKTLDVNKYCAFSAYNLSDHSRLEEELKRYESAQNALLPPPLYLSVALKYYKAKDYTNAWWGYERAIVYSTPESYESLKPSILEAYVITAIKLENYRSALGVSGFLKANTTLTPYQKAYNLYHHALAAYKTIDAKTALPDADAALLMNPAGDLKYQLILLVGMIDLDRGEAQNGTRLLQQVILLAPKKQNDLKVQALEKLIAYLKANPSAQSEQKILEYQAELKALQ